MRKFWIGGLGLLALALPLPMCTGVPMTAPSGSDLKLIANPTFVPANGGVSVITAIVTEPAGTPPPNGTVVFFFTDLGSVDAEGKTKDGVARVNFVSDSRSGTATVRGVSGGVAESPAATPTPGQTPTPPPSPQTHFIPALFEMAVARAAGTNSDAVTITVGAGLGTKVLAVVSPARISSPGSALVTANVFNADGNPVANVPVIFSFDLTTGTLYETLDSGGAPQFTDTNGQAFDTVRTRAPIGVAHSVTIKATIPGPGTPGSVTLAVN